MVVTRCGVARDELGWLLYVGCIVALSGCENYCRSSGIFGREQVCDPSKEIDFLAVGDVEGNWYREGESKTDGPAFSFDKKGHLDHILFGCKPRLWPLVVDGLNSRQSFMGFEWKSLENYEVRPGFFRLEFLRVGFDASLEGQLRDDGRFYLKASGGAPMSGVFVKGDPPKENDNPTPESDWPEDSLTGTGGSSDGESTETTATGSEY